MPNVKITKQKKENIKADKIIEILKPIPKESEKEVSPDKKIIAPTKSKMDLDRALMKENERIFNNS